MTKNAVTIIIGSNNPVKIVAVKKAFESVLTSNAILVSGYAANSGVSDQPMSQEEAMRGACNRAKSALASQPDVQYGVGVEGGIYKTNNGWFDAQWVSIIRKDGLLGIGSGIHIPVPDMFVAAIQSGKELGEVIDEYWEQSNMKQAEGYVGRVTNGLISREQMIIPGVISALIPFTNPELFQPGQ